MPFQSTDSTHAELDTSAGMAECKKKKKLLWPKNVSISHHFLPLSQVSWEEILWQM